MVKDFAPLPSSSNAFAPAMAEVKVNRAGSIQASNGRTREAVVRDIVNGLYDGRYEPGQRLQEAQLTTAYGIKSWSGPRGSQCSVGHGDRRSHTATRRPGA